MQSDSPGDAGAMNGRWPRCSYTFPTAVAIALPLGGVADPAGVGELTLPLAAPPAASGFAFCHQAFVYDLAAAGSRFTQTNGLELRYPQRATEPVLSASRGARRPAAPRRP